jgi:hypothetical protein
VPSDGRQHEAPSRATGSGAGSAFGGVGATRRHSPDLRSTPTMRITAVSAMIFWVASTYGERRAIAAEPFRQTVSHEGASGDQPPVAGRAPLLNAAIDRAPLRCECAPQDSADWHWSERRILGLKVLGFGVLSGAAGLVFAWSVDRTRLEAIQNQPSFIAATRSAEIRERRVAALGLLGVASVAALAGAGLVLWPEGHVSVTVLPSGGALVACGSSF